MKPETVQYVYKFSQNHIDGDCSMKSLLGSKGANLAEMLKIGIPVPPGFTISTAACFEYYQNSRSLLDVIKSQVVEGIIHLENTLGKRFGGPNSNLLVSVRSGAAISMPGMMDTILNLGLNDSSVKLLATSSKNERFAYDSYRRFIQMYSSVVLGIDLYEFEKIFNNHKRRENISQDQDIDSTLMNKIIDEYKDLIIKRTGREFPEDPWEQLWGAVCAVFDSWYSNRAKKYRAIHSISDDIWTAANVQAMVFGNFGDNSATGVMFTRCPSNGEKRIFGEFLPNAQGEDIVSGTYTPLPISISCKHEFGGSDIESFEEKMPQIFSNLIEIAEKLENHYKEMQDIEFTIEDGKLWILQTRTGKRSAQANIKIALDMLDDRILSDKEALMKVSAKNIEQLIHPVIDPNETSKVIARGLPASPGAASGQIVFSSKAAEDMSRSRSVILVRHETSPEDIAGMNASCGILTARGGMTSHAAVVARSMGKPCVCGASSITIDVEKRTLKIGTTILKEEDWITINGMNGDIIAGKVATVLQGVSNEYRRITKIADSFAKMSVMANAETKQDAKIALEFGALGIGLCRTEHMFFQSERIFWMRKMILSKEKEERVKALNMLLPYQQQDFLDLFEIMLEKPIVIRLLDPPLHEFLPLTNEEIERFAGASGNSVDYVATEIARLKEVNPMLGHRGSRLAVTYPEIYSMQVKAILLAARQFAQQAGIYIIPEIMVPLIMNAAELQIVKKIVCETALEVKAQFDFEAKFLFGTMIELPKLALEADKIAPLVDFCSFGTNDLTQMVMGISRDDCAKFLPTYLEQKIFQKDPFVSIDTNGVGQLIRLSVQKAKSTNPNIKLGVCGEHGGDPESIKFFHDSGLDYVSCSPYRVSIARLAAGQSAF